MKKILTTLILLSSFAFANELANKLEIKDLKHPKQAVLWKVEGKDLKTPSFLFGTMHVSDPRITTLHPLAEEAFQKSDVIYTEIDLSPESQMASMPGLIREDGKGLSDSIGAEVMKELNTTLQKINPALTAEPFETMKTWFVAMSLQCLEDQLSGKMFLDAVLFQRAAAEEKERDALETLDSQNNIFDQFSEEEQMIMLKSAINHMDHIQIASDELIEIYITGNASDIAAYLKDYMKKSQAGEYAELSNRLMKLLLDDRNKTMSATIIKRLKAAPDKAHFFAAGAAHYTGETAIQNFLKKEGYTITPMFK